MKSAQYNLILHEARRKELRLKKETLENLISLLNSVSNDLEGAIAKAADHTGTLRKEQLQAMKARIDEDLDIFEDQYDRIVKGGITGQTEIIISRNGEIFIEVEGTRKLIDTMHDTVLAQILDYKEKDGLILSDRIWRMSQEAKTDITNRISQGILLGESHVKVAKDIRQYVVGGSLKYKSQRLAITEMAKAYKLANEKSVQIMREESQFMWYEKWELSPAHPHPDVCDILATQNPEGEGPGIYKTAPNRHPMCYCYIYPVYRPKRGKGTYPNVSPAVPNTENLDKSQHKLAKELT